MKKKIFIIAAVVVPGLVILVLFGGTLFQALGVEVFCISSEDGRIRFVPCNGEEDILLEADTAPPRMSADAQPALIDTDMAADDWMAILYLLQRPDVDVRAITVTGAGEAHCGPGVQNALDLVALAGRADIPVTCGRETPLAGDHVFPQSWREQVDRLAGVSIPANPNPPAGQDAVELITATIHDAPGDLMLVALGPLTNLAEAFQADPSLPGEIQQVYIMGGAFEVPGNIGDAPELGIDNDAAEWNIYVDPHAAALVVASGAPITFVPLDASNQVLLDEAFYDRLSGDRTTPEAEFVYQVLTENIGFVRSGNYYFWDPLTVAIAVDNNLGIFETGPVVVFEAEGPESGATRLAEDGSQALIAMDADGGRFKQVFLDVLNGRVGE